MVDFNNDTTITGRSAEDILRVIIMERRYNLFEAVENYVKLASTGNESDQEIAVIKARLYSLFLEIEETVKRNLLVEKYAELLKLMESNQYDDLNKAIKIIMRILDTIRLTKLDTRKNYDTTDVVLEDKIKGH